MSTTHQESKKSSVPNMSGKVMTVKGPIDPGQLGVTIMHEHLFLDLQSGSIQPTYDTPATDLGLRDHKLTLDNLYLARDKKPIGDNVRLGDEQLAIVEVTHYRYAGGGTIVDVTPKGLRPDPAAARRVSYATGVNVVMGTSWHSPDFHPADMDQRTVEDLADEIIHDVTVGNGQTGIRSGIIGEVGIEGYPLIPNEIKSIRAAARASRATGAAITFHRAGRGNEKLKVLDMVEEEGADLARTIIGHCDIVANDLPFLTELLERGVYVEFDLMGRLDVPLTAQPPRPEILPAPRLLSGFPLTSLISEAIVKLTEAGYEDRILLSHDAFPKLQFKSYGGTGYAFVLEKFLPHLRTLGVTEEQINKFMVENPKRVLTFVAPQ